MSVTEGKAKSTKKTSAKIVSTSEQSALKSALDAAQIEYVPLSDLIKSPLNVRTIPYPVESVRGLADTIAAIGLLQNLVVHTLPDGKSGVAAGGRRLTAMQLLCSEQRLSGDYPVPVKRVTDELASVASVAENEQRASMHPAEQISSFRILSEQGNTPAKIGEQLGYSSRHVQRMLKLANLAPSLLALLAEDQINVEQCQVLCLEDDQARQVAIFEGVKAGWEHPPVHLLKARITETEISVSDPRFQLIGRASYEAAGGLVREDLFSQQEGEGTADAALVERLAQEKLEAAALAIQTAEGWAWSMGRAAVINRYGQDGQDYVLLSEPAPVYTGEERAKLDEMYDLCNTFDSLCDELDALEAEIAGIEQDAALRAWEGEVRASAGVVVSLFQGEIRIQRGVCRIADMPEVQEETRTTAEITTLRKPDAAEGISLPLLTKMSSERTLAVQAALMQQPVNAVALMAWRLCMQVFSGTSADSHPFRISLTVAHSSLTENAPSGREGAGYSALMQEKTRLETLLPQGWKKDFTTFFDLDGSVLMSLMAFCTACSVEGVQNREFGHTSRSSLDTLETAIGFHMRDWWHPTKENFFTHLKHSQIVAALNEAGMSGAARDAEKMKKGDAASHAEAHISDTRWVPAWMKASEPQARTEADGGSDEKNGAHAA
ncbi:ParB/RepB/Spo0J family partition protein [Pantoea cypripedii]|uniref:ParB/RepB/Spo0J family partition protein n=1 Tax=Pantoea cypripedii TaxID=55209 RepID=UPI002FC5C520